MGGRDPRGLRKAFAAGHLAASLSFGLDRSVAPYLASLLDGGRR